MNGYSDDGGQQPGILFVCPCGHGWNRTPGMWLKCFCGASHAPLRIGRDTMPLADAETGKERAT